MSWRVRIRPEVGDDIVEAAGWYASKERGLDEDFCEEVLKVIDELAENPLLNSRRHPKRNIHWRYPKRFPYRVIYEVDGDSRTVVVAAVLHAARSDRGWEKRMGV